MRNAILVLGLAGVILAGPAAMRPAAAQTGATAATRSPVPAMPPPVSVAGSTAAQSSTNPPELVAPPATVGAAPPLSAPLTGSNSGSLAGSDQIDPSVGGGVRH